MQKIPLSLSEYSYISIVDRYLFAKHVVNIVRLSSGFWANPATIHAFSVLMIPYRCKSLLTQAHDAARDIIRWKDYK